MVCIAVGHAVTLHYNPAAHTSSKQQPQSAQDTKLGLSRWKAVVRTPPQGHTTAVHTVPAR